MRHNETFLSTILCKLLQAQVLSLYNHDNPFSETLQHARTGNMKIYNWRASFLEVVEDFGSHSVIVGMIRANHVMHVCYFSKAGIIAYPLTFVDADGFWSCNLCYSRVHPLNSPTQFSSKEAMMEEAHDYFILFWHKESNKGTILCHSWRVHIDSGDIVLLSQQKMYCYWNEKFNDEIKHSITLINYCFFVKILRQVHWNISCNRIGILSPHFESEQFQEED